MSTSPDQKLYDYTKALAYGLSSLEGNLKSFLPNLYLENRNLYGEFAPLVYEGDYPDRFAQAYDEYLDLIGASFGVFRGPNEKDNEYRQKIKLRIIQSNTTSGIARSVETVFAGLGLSVNVNVKNAFNSFFDAVGSNFNTEFRGELGSRYYRITIDIDPSFRDSVPNYVDSVISGFSYDIPKNGQYKITFDPDNLFDESQSVGLSIIDSQFSSRTRTIFSSETVESGFSLDLGFLSIFQSLFIESSAGLSYISKLEFNNVSFDFYRNPAYNGILTAFGINFLRELFDDIAAFGISIERIIIRQAGSGG